MSSFERSELIPKKTSPKEALNPSVAESLKPEGEWQFVDTSAIIIAGPPGSGSSSISALLTERFSIPEDKNWYIGKLRRKAEGMPIEEVLHFNKEKELATDAITKNVLLISTPDDPVIVEAQLGGYIGKDTSSFRILINADETTRAERVKMREDEKVDQEIEDKKLHPEKYIGKEVPQKYSVEQWVLRNKARTKRNLASWKKTYPQLRGKSPFDKDLQFSNKKVYDLFIDSTNLRPEKIIDIIVFHMQITGKIRKTG